MALRHPAQPRTQRILPLHDADARPPEGVPQGQAEQGAGRARGGGAALLLGLPVLLPFPLRGANCGDGRIASAAHQLGLPGCINGCLPGQSRPRRGDVLRCEPRSCIGIHVGVSWARAPIVGTCRRGGQGAAVTREETGECVIFLDLGLSFKNSYFKPAGACDVAHGNTGV